MNETVVIAKRMYNMMKSGKIEAASTLAWDHARNMIEDVDFINDSMWEQYKELRDYLRTTPIAIPDEYKADTDWNAIRRQNMGRMRLVNKGHGVMIDQVYQEMQERWPEFFDEEIHDHPADQVLQISDVLDSLQPYVEAYTSEEAMGLAENIASELWDIVMEGKEYKSIADTFKDKFDKRTAAMKLRHQEAMAKAKENAAKMVQREKTKHREYVEKQRDIRDHAKHYGSIQNNYDWLTSRLLNPTKEKNIPEGLRVPLAKMLQFFDLQTERSKALEEVTGRAAQKTMNMRELQAKLKQIASEEDGFDIDANLEYMMEAMANKLDGKSIDSMDATDLATIDTLLKAIKHQFVRMNQIRVEGKMMEISEMGDRVISDMTAQIEKKGMAKTYGGVRGALDTLINLEEMTPVYFFEKLGPGMSDMYNVLRRTGFDQYIRNTKMINERMEEMLGQYKNQGKGLHKGQDTVPGSILETWQDDSNAQTFELTHGTITMSPAQMMSLYCLSKREQAMGHMTVGGIVVTPIQTSSKIEAAKERIAGKTESNVAIRLTEADIEEIVSKLTPEQLKVADELQSFMINEMAELGNEAHMEMYGYKAFKDQNYFPITVHGNEISMDINNIGEVVEKIKSLGFTKPVTPGANNKVVVDNIFDVVADHCNKMNLYNSYLVPISDFMRVYNYKQRFDDGQTVSVRDSIEGAYGKNALTFINNFMKDINGVKDSGRGGMDNLLNNALGKAKTAAVFGNARVFLQQPTAIARALAVVDAKHFSKSFMSKDNLAEMLEHCPIAYWKSLGNYEMFMGRDIKDIMMNNWSMREKLLSDWYGAADNATWSWIWGAVKNQVKAENPGIEVGSEEFWDKCNSLMTTVVDKTQVVDSTFHRSNMMRNKAIHAKLMTAFMAEPTLTFNVLRDGMSRAYESMKAGDMTAARKVATRTAAVIVTQQVLVSFAQALMDGWRGKRPKLPWEDDDDLLENMTKDQLIAYAKEHGIALPEKAKKAEILETIQAAERTPGAMGAFERYWERVGRNMVNNFLDEGRFWNKLYGWKEVGPFIERAMTVLTDPKKEDETMRWIRTIMGWESDYLYDSGNLLISNLKKAEKGYEAILKEYRSEEPEGDLYDRYYDKIQQFMSGFAALTGLPAPTLMRDFKPILDLAHDNMIVSAADEIEQMAVPEPKPVETKKDAEAKASSISDSVASEVASEKTSDKAMTKTEQMATDESLSFEKREYFSLKAKAENALANYKGKDRDEKLWDVVSEGYLQHISSGDFRKIDEMRSIVSSLGGDVEQFDSRVFRATKIEFKKKLTSDKDEDGNYIMDFEAVYAMRDYLKSQGMTDAEISSEILYKTYMAKDLKAAFRLGNEEYIMNELVPLVAAGLTREDYEKLYKYRNRYQNYTGKYAKAMKSTGRYNWPITGTVTSEFGYRPERPAGTSSNHKGIDIAANVGDPVGAADGGQVVHTGWNNGWGYQVVVRHEDGTETYYSHLSAYNVHVGDSVAQGQQIGQIGSTGQSTGPHLDFMVKVNGAYVDPREYLA